MTPIQVRRLAGADVHDFRTIRLAALRTAARAFGSTYDVEAARPIADVEKRLETVIVFGAYHEGQIAGMVGLRQEDGVKVRHKGFVWGFYVQPDLRRRGIGEALFTAVLDAADGMVEQLHLSVVQGNDGAIGLYRKFGFESYGVEPRSLKTDEGYDDELMMVRFLRRA